MRNIIMSWEGKRRQVEAFVCLLVSVCVCVSVWVEDENQTT